MKEIANIPDKDRDLLFRNTAGRRSLTPAIIEKDFWVCWTLDYLFQQSKWKNSMIFKGGTSLSKAYNLIQRFSEDIDLILDWRALGYRADEPWEERSNKKQEEFNRQANERSAAYLKDEVSPVLQEDFSRFLGKKADVHISPEDDLTIIFSYPHLYSGNGTVQEIRLEVGPLAAATPAAKQTITPYAAESYPHVFRQPSTEVKTVLPERTFWEKVLILHSEAHRPVTSPMPPRYSRHYYDVVMISDSPVKDAAFADGELLKKVTAFKKKFYPLNRARYDDVLSGNIRLLPSDTHMKDLKEDYAKMQQMIFEERYSFDEIVERLAALETEMSSLFR
ncbi:MAG TPA: nucleotidyl transferase AbiEii/AbiGii toxin family protein [Methanocorpusculum sp.]|nr:nucleotidyl transferase AbiEii/AbiGii toxin family protein [Methanocorpusculum sp.]